MPSDSPLSLPELVRTINGAFADGGYAERVSEDRLAGAYWLTVDPPDGLDIVGLCPTSGDPHVDEIMESLPWEATGPIVVGALRVRPSSDPSAPESRAYWVFDFDRGLVLTESEAYRRYLSPGSNRSA